MTFAEVLPHLIKGRIAKEGASWYRMAGHYLERRNTCDHDVWMREPLDRRMVLASDWELVEEPRPGCHPTCDQQATIARLTRELAEAKEHRARNQCGHTKDGQVCCLHPEHGGVMHCNGYRVWTS